MKKLILAMALVALLVVPISSCSKTTEFKSGVSAPALSSREPQMLDPNASDAETVKSLINKLEYKAEPVLSVPEGFMGIPWGASREVVEKEMAERHFPKDSDWKVDHYIYDGSFAGYPAYLSFHFENNKFVDGGAVLIEVFHSINDGTGYNFLADKYFSILEGQLIEKYGEPYYRYKAEGNEPWKPYASYWKVKYYPLYPSVIEEHTIKISVDKCHAYKDRDIDQYSRVSINYTNATLKENEKKRSRDQDI